MSGFSSLNLGTRALFAAQRAMDTTGQNIGNANTDGYSRQRVDQVAAGGPVVPALFSRWDGAGAGVDVSGIVRIRDEFLETRALHEHAANASLQASQQLYGDIETTFGEPSDSGLQAQMSSFWNSWDDVANDPSGLAPRGQLLERAKALAGSFNGVGGRLRQQWGDAREQLGTTVEEVNSLAADVARLNATIRSATVAGVSANEVTDQRDALVLRLGQSIGALATAGDDGVVNVTIAGSPLVTGDRARPLALTGPTTYPGAPGSVALVWGDGSGYPVSGVSGTVAARLDAVDSVMPYYLASLDAVASSFASTVNAQQAAGYDLTGAAGTPVFRWSPGQLTVVLPTSSGLAASSAPPPALDGDNALAMAARAGDALGPDGAYRELIVGLGVRAQSVNRQATVQAVVTTQIDNARQSVSGVSLDEEMANLMSYQHAYQAAARFISTIDSTLDVLVNMTR
jgi:flagellar hook-associated protein 1 FlgK